MSARSRPPAVGRRDPFRLAAGGLGAAALSGCGTGPAPTHRAIPVVTLTWWDYLVDPGRQAGVRALIAAVEASLPGLRIRRRVMSFDDLAATLRAGAATGNLPDIAIVDNPTVGPLAARGVLADLTGRVAAWGQSDQYYAGPWRSCEFGGKVFAVPNNANCLALYCNTALLARARVTPPTTWAELSAAAHALTRGSVRGLALSATRGEEGVFQFLPFLWQTGGDLDSFATHGATALAFVAGLVRSGALDDDAAGWNQTDVKDEFLAGRAAMQINGPWQLPALHAQHKIGWQVVPLPSGLKAATALGGENWVIFGSGDRADLAWQAVRRTQQPDVLVPFLTALGVLPARTDLLGQGPWAGDPAMRVFLTQMDRAHARAFGAHYDVVSAAVSQAEQAVFAGSATPPAAAATAATTIAANLTR